MDAPFWKDGLRFECTRCSGCCRHEPGFVFLSASDIRRLLKASGLEFRQFIDTVLRTVDIGTGNAICLKEKPNNDCILWGEAGCSFYDSRPIQCSTYPFWKGVVDSADDWARESESCPGIGRGSIRTEEFIAECLLKRRGNHALTIAYDVALESTDEDTLLGSSRIPSDSADACQA
ncbi:MAG: YkgJ family cysteine cluster protein [Spirochaetia bacterium]|nr:YkgJ family cysteine cluster protein [Spirochaetia bacterium]